MSRKMSVLAFAAALVMTPLAHAADVARDQVRTREEAAEITAPLPEPAITLAKLFADAQKEEEIVLLDGVASGMGALEVVVARTDTGGKLVFACVDSKEAAELFLKKPLDKLATKEAKEQ